MTNIRGHIAFSHKGASAKLEYMSTHIFSLRNVWSKNRQQGEATELMRTIERYADANNMTLLLVVQAYGHPHHNTMSSAQLAEWYTKFGFEINPDYKHIPHMIRYPSREKHGT